MTSYTVGIDIGGTKIAVGAMAESGELISRRSERTPAHSGPQAILATAIRMATELMTVYPIGAIGVGSAGVIDPVARKVVAATDQLSNWAGTQLGTILEAALGVPVTTHNDVHAHAVGEAFTGAGRGQHIVLVTAIGTGIGGAVVIDGVPQTGAHNVGGHLGHIPVEEAAGLVCPCGRVGHLEAISSGKALLQLYLRLGGSADLVSTREVVAATETDPIAHAAVTTSALALGRAMGGLVNVVDPDVLIIAGGMRNAGELWWSNVKKGIQTEVMPILKDIPIVPAQLGDDAAIIGAAKCALDARGVAA